MNTINFLMKNAWKSVSIHVPYLKPGSATPATGYPIVRKTGWKSGSVIAGRVSEKIEMGKTVRQRRALRLG
jgi:hypothetical protein